MKPCSSCGRAGSIQRNIRGVPEIAFNAKDIIELSNEGLTGSLAHEVGHLVSGHIDHDQSLPVRIAIDLEKSKKAVYLRQRQADAVAIRLVGAQTLLVSYLELGTESATAERYIREARQITGLFICEILW